MGCEFIKWPGENGMELFDELHTLYVSLEDEVELLQMRSTQLVAKRTPYGVSDGDGLQLLKQNLSDIRCLKQNVEMQLSAPPSAGSLSEMLSVCSRFVKSVNQSLDHSGISDSCESASEDLKNDPSEELTNDENVDTSCSMQSTLIRAAEDGIPKLTDIGISKETLQKLQLYKNGTDENHKGDIKRPLTNYSDLTSSLRCGTAPPAVHGVLTDRETGSEHDEKIGYIVQMNANNNSSAAKPPDSNVNLLGQRLASPPKAPVLSSFARQMLGLRN